MPEVKYRPSCKRAVLIRPTPPKFGECGLPAVALVRLHDRAEVLCQHHRDILEAKYAGLPGFKVMPL